jgi:2-oxoglutarate dehydrogenase E2 component (dihydrolipoamide succinyltransferase)
MKIIVLAAALVVAAPAFAQDTTAAPDQGAPAAAPAPAEPAPAPAAAPAASSMPTPTPVDSASLPTCSAKVTDRCIQKGASGRHARTSKAHHKPAKKKATK